jgi:hypothetical protein
LRTGTHIPSICCPRHYQNNPKIDLTPKPIPNEGVNIFSQKNHFCFTSPPRFSAEKLLNFSRTYSNTFPKYFLQVLFEKNAAAAFIAPQEFYYQQIFHNS